MELVKLELTVMLRQAETVAEQSCGAPAAPANCGYRAGTRALAKGDIAGAKQGFARMRNSDPTSEQWAVSEGILVPGGPPCGSRRGEPPCPEDQPEIVHGPRQSGLPALRSAPPVRSAHPLGSCAADTARGCRCAGRHGDRAAVASSDPPEPWTSIVAPSGQTAVFWTVRSCVKSSCGPRLHAKRRLLSSSRCYGGS